MEEKKGKGKGDPPNAKNCNGFVQRDTKMKTMDDL